MIDAKQRAAIRAVRQDINTYAVALAAFSKSGDMSDSLKSSIGRIARELGHSGEFLTDMLEKAP